MVINLRGSVYWLIQVDWFMILCDKTAKLFKTFLYLYSVFYILYVFVHMILQDCSANKPTLNYYCVVLYWYMISEPTLKNPLNKVCMLCYVIVAFRDLANVSKK
jgi:hypothetical protein